MFVLRLDFIFYLSVGVFDNHSICLFLYLPRLTLSILAFRQVKRMYSRQNPRFAKPSLKELATLPCIARLRVRKRPIRSRLSFEGLSGWSMGKLRIGIHCNQDIVISIL